VVDYVRRWSDRTDLPAKTLTGWIGVGTSKFYNWKQRYGKLNEHNAWVPRDRWLEEWERQAILDFQREFPLEGYYPQSNGKKERWYQTLKRECLRRQTPLSLEDARRVVAVYVEHYNRVRLRSALGYVTPADKLAGHENEIFARRDCKLEEARQRRKARRAAERIDSIDFTAIRRQVTMEQVLRHLGHLDCLRGSGPQRRGPCPVHGSSHAGSRSFSVNFEKGVFHCFCPECGAHDPWGRPDRVSPERRTAPERVVR
jgi:hypothetical protein